MKKRLLSAALALAMVLTLLPVSAFAANVTAASGADPDTIWKTYDKDGNGVTHFYEKNATTGAVTSVTVQRCSTVGSDGREYGKWYWLDNVNKDANGDYTYYEVTSGIVAGVGGSGTWYKDLNDFTNTSTTGVKTVKSTSFTILGTGSLDLSAYNNPTLTVDMEAGSSLTVPTVLTSLTVTGKYVSGTSGTKGTVNGLTTTRTAFANPAPSNVTIKATDVNVGAISLAGRTNSVTLSGCTVSSVTLDGETITNANGTKAYNNQTLTASDCAFSGAVSVSNATPAVSLTNCSGVTGVTYTSTSSGTFTVAGTTNVTGAFAVTPRDKASTYPNVAINGGSVTGITQTAVSGNANSMTVGVNNSGASVTGAVTLEKGTLNVASGKITGAVTVKEGNMNVSGYGVNIGGVTTLGANGATTLSITATGSSMNGITAANGSNLKISNWPAGRVNSYGALSLNGYVGNGVKGGSFDTSSANDFGTAANMNWFDTSLQFYSVPKAASTTIALYGRNELAVAIAESNAPKNGTSGTGIAVLGQATGAQVLTLMNGGDEWAKIGYNTTSKFVLPTQINTVKVGSWVVDSQTGGSNDGNKRTFVAGAEEAIACPTGGLVLNANPNGTSANAEKITNATNASGTPGSGVVLNEDVKVTLSDNRINLSGAVTYTAGGFATVKVLLTTDVLKTGTVNPGDSPYETLTVDVLWDVEKKTFQFDKSLKLDLGAIIDANGDLVLNNGVGAHYTVGGSLAVSASKLNIVDQSRAAESIVGAVGGSLSSRIPAQKQVLIDAIQTGSSFDYSGSPAFREAVNAAQASITSNTTVDGWINTARTAVWRSGYKDSTTVTGYKANMVPHSTNFASVAASDADKTAVSKAFDTAYIVPYLLITATNETQTGELTLTVQPYYRVDVSASTYSNTCYHTVQAGRALSLSGEMGDGIELTLPLTALVNISKDYMHQDGKYVYAAASNAYTITHIGANGTLGTMVLNGADGPISLVQTTANGGATLKYDNLQAAIDDTGVETVASGAITGKDKITVPGSYAGSCAVTMTGLARTIDVELQGLHTLTWSGAELSVTKSDATGIYTLQLKKDTAPTGGNITVNSATGGSASVNANPASAGQTVTITLSASNGYTPSGVTVKDSSGKTVSVSGSGSKYTFTMPSGSVTVTPSFTLSQTVRKATVSVSPNSMGTTTTTAAATSNQVDAGSSVGVTTLPASGYRTMGVNISTNGGAATATRQGDNYFTFTVPSNATAVTVTPIYDRDNGTKFSDVWSTEYYSKSVAWAVRQGITNGTSTYGFSPSVTCTRAQMMTFLWRVAGRPTVSGVNNPFVDVYPGMGSDYYNAILWAVSKGITNGTDATHFSPSGTVTRAQAITFLYRYEGSPTVSASTGFYDVPSTEYYARAVSWAKSKGVTDGTSTYYFSPSQGVTRAQAVTFLYRDRTGDIA